MLRNGLTDQRTFTFTFTFTSHVDGGIAGRSIYSGALTVPVNVNVNVNVNVCSSVNPLFCYSKPLIT